MISKAESERHMESQQLSNYSKMDETYKQFDALQESDTEEDFPNLLVLSYDKEYTNIIDINREMKQIRMKKILSNPIILKIIAIHIDNINSSLPETDSLFEINDLSTKPSNSWVNDSLKLKILRLHNIQMMTKAEISRQLLTPYSTIWRIIRRFRENPKTTREFFVSRPVNLLYWDRAQKAVLEYIRFNIYPFNSTEIQRFLLKTTGIDWTKSSIIRYLKESLNLSYKRVSSRLVKRPASLTKLMKIVFWIEYANMINSRIVVVNIDETLFSNSTKRNYSWTKRGGPAYAENIWFTGSVSFIVSITSSGSIHNSHLQENNNSSNFINYLKDLIKWLDEDL